MGMVYNIKELSAEVGVPIYLIAYWVQKKLIVPEVRHDGRRRREWLFSERNKEQVMGLWGIQHLHLPLGVQREVMGMYPWGVDGIYYIGKGIQIIRI
mgnify:CR=1 FL=1